jgi:hypothetical protein
MKKTIRVLVSVVFLCMGASAAHAQFHLAIGPLTGGNFNLHTGSDLSSTGTGFGFVIGGQAVMSFTPTLGLVEGLTFYDNRSGSFSRTGPSQVYTNATQTSDVSVSLAYLQLENLFLLKLPRSGMYFVVGPVLGFNVEGSQEVTTKHVDNNNPNNTASDPKVKNSLKDVLVRFELKLGAGYDISISRDVLIAPQFTFGFGLTKVVSDVSYRVLTFQLVTSVKFNLI